MFRNLRRFSASTPAPLPAFPPQVWGRWWWGKYLYRIPTSSLPLNLPLNVALGNHPCPRPTRNILSHPYCQQVRFIKLSQVCRSKNRHASYFSDIESRFLNGTERMCGANEGKRWWWWAGHQCSGVVWWALGSKVDWREQPVCVAWDQAVKWSEGSDQSLCYKDNTG